ncbi:hypothetical protein EsDP_00002649 [Epichloe bromicola]|uniref:Transcription regulator BDF1 n=1 Tax=Epichloe bromicola TaxID=79588 RepID=A0ABQ0CLE7_9HYPO
MDTSGSDAPALDPKPHIAAGEEEQDGQKTELNGHSVDTAPKSEPQPELKSESVSQSAVATEKQADALPEATKIDSEKSVVNGSNSSDERPSLNGFDAAVKEGSKPASKPEDDDAKPATEVASAIAAPEAAEASPTSGSNQPNQASLAQKDDESTKPSEDVAMRDSPDADNILLPETKGDEDKKADEPVEESSNKAAIDTEMVDSPAERPKLLAAEESVITSQEAATLPTSEVDLGPASMSQLAIETTEKTSSPTEAPGDVSMADAPSAKVARERDEDMADDEPAPKRARTEPKDDEPVAPAPTEGQAEVMVSDTETPGLSLRSLSKLSNWVDEETNKRPISAFQRREMRKIIGRVKKTKAGIHFRDSVQKLWPGLWDSYVAKVSRPMDLAELERGLRDLGGPYNTFGDFRKDLSLVFENALDFNGPLHDITGSAATAVRAVWEEMLPIPSEEPMKPKAAPKPKPVRESRVVANTDTAARRQSAGPTASPAADAIASSKAVVATAQDQSAADRRSSTATEGDRPKRTVRAPKPKDIDYTTKPSRKKLKPELQFADEVLAEVMAGKHHHMNQWFMDPVDAEGLNIPTYYSVIKKPMDLNKVSRMLSSGEISSLKEFEKTVRLIFDNCFKFNGPVEQGNPVSALAKQLEDLFLAQLKGKDVWLAKHAKANAPASASNASDEDEDDEDEEGDGAAEVVVDSKEIEELQAKLDEETKKLNSMLLTSNQSMIDIQKNIVDMVQKTLIGKAHEAQAARAKAKSDKPKKHGKNGKAKAGASGGRKSTGGQAKKAGGPKKAATKKSLTAAQKDQIANGINDLEFPHLDRAIDIIKKDTGQNENNDGELELDIDQLSQDALGKLWDLCRKALPGFAKDMEPVPAPEASRPSAKQSSKASTAAKPKKNKPMSASEQEQRIAELQALSQMYRNPQDSGDGPGVTQAPTPGAESSDDSDSEEE